MISDIKSPEGSNFTLNVINLLGIVSNVLLDPIESMNGFLNSGFKVPRYETSLMDSSVQSNQDGQSPDANMKNYALFGATTYPKSFAKSRQSKALSEENTIADESMDILSIIMNPVDAIKGLADAILNTLPAFVLDTLQNNKTQTEENSDTLPMPDINSSPIAQDANIYEVEPRISPRVHDVGGKDTIKHMKLYGVVL